MGHTSLRWWHTPAGGAVGGADPIPLDLAYFTLSATAWRERLRGKIGQHDLSTVNPFPIHP